MSGSGASFGGSMPESYDRYLGPVWLERYAQDLVARLPVKPAGDVLEIACGTGILTRRLRERLDPEVRLVATDISSAMLDYARAKHAALAGVEWLEADALDLPFPDARFAAAACGFGLMFPPDRARALREARRVLRRGGALVFNVWDRIEANPTALANARVVEDLFPGDAEMRFRLPYDMYDADALRALLGEAGFRALRIETVRVPIEAPSAREVAIGQIRGTPRSSLIEKRGVPLEQVIERVTAALAEVGGAQPYRASAQAVVVEAVAE